MTKTIVKPSNTIHTGPEEIQCQTRTLGAREASGYRCSASSWPREFRIRKSSSSSAQILEVGSSPSGTWIQTAFLAPTDARSIRPCGLRSNHRSTRVASDRGRSQTTHGIAILVPSNSSASSSTAEHRSPARDPEGTVVRLPARASGGVAQCRAPHHPDQTG